MNITKRNKVALAIGTSALVVGTAGTALAYWTTSGSTNGSAATDTGAANLSVTQISAPTLMAPGVTAGAVAADVTNNSVDTVKVNQVLVTIGTVTPAQGATGTCDASDYTLSNATMTNGAGELAHTATAHFTGASLGFNDKTDTNQDGCKGATVTLHYAVS